MEVAAFHPLPYGWERLVSVALFLALYLAAFSGRPLAATLLDGARTFLPLLAQPATARPASGAIIGHLGINHRAVIPNFHNNFLLKWRSQRAWRQKVAKVDISSNRAPSPL